MPNCGLLRNDFAYFLDKAKSQNENEIANRYARAAIIFMVFYLEALINLIIEHFIKTMNKPIILKKLKNDSNIPKKFKAVYSFLSHDQLANICDIKGIEDLFRVRSQIFAHPKSYGITSGANVPVGKGLTIDGKEISYSKLISLPNTLDHFKTEHAQIIYNEIKQFLSNYYNLVKPFLHDYEYLSYYFNLP